MSVASGNSPADLVLTNAQLLNVATREIYPVEIAIKSGRIAALAAPGSGSWDRLESVDLAGRYVSPGFMDPHVHIEGSLVTPQQFSRAVTARGTTLVAQDPHEIANVCGMAGVRAMLADAEAARLRILLRVPGRVPGYPQELESTSGELSLDDTLSLLDLPETVCLAGDYNPQWVLRGEPDLMSKIDRTIRLGKTVSGQPAGVRGATLNCFVVAGFEDSHVASSVDEILENQRLGLRTTLVMRPGRRLGREHVRELASLIERQHLETRFIQLSTDEVYPSDLLDEGHLDQRIRLCIEEGVPIAVAYQWATLNVAEGLRIDRDYGTVAPGKAADLVILDDLATVKVHASMIGGAFVDNSRATSGSVSRSVLSAPQFRAVSLRRPLAATDFVLRVQGEVATVGARAIITDAPKCQDDIVLPVEDGTVQADSRVSFLAMVECHGGSGRIGLGFVGGLRLESGAIATTVSHDAHNMLIIGQNRADMALAGNRLAEIGGGYIAVRDGEVICELALPVAGLMSLDEIEPVAAALRRFEEVLVADLGCPPASQLLMRLNVLSMANSASCGFSDGGLIDAHSMSMVSTIIS